MTPAQAQQLDDIAWCVDAILNMRLTIAGGRFKGQAVPFTAAILKIQNDVDDLSTGGGLTDHQHTTPASTTGGVVSGS